MTLTGRGLKQARTQELWAEAESTANKAGDPLGLTGKQALGISSLPTFYITVHLYITPMQTGKKMSKWESNHSTHIFYFWDSNLSQWSMPSRTVLGTVSLKQQNKTTRRSLHLLSTHYACISAYRRLIFHGLVNTL